jgi:hypothetical protein
MYTLLWMDTILTTTSTETTINIAAVGSGLISWLAL